MKKGYAEFTMHWDDAPLDVSWMFEEEKPAGKHGFARVQNGKFVFEDGTPARFWGTLLNSAACFPPHDIAEIVARRLAKFGVNLVRLHQFDSEWATPNIFQFSKGMELKNTLELDPESLDRLDYLIARLKAEGIYIFFDFLVYRNFKDGDGVKNAGEFYQFGAKPYSVFDPTMIKLQKRYCDLFLDHVNPYTGLAYKDEPALAAAMIKNENNTFSFDIEVEPYRTNYEKAYRAWSKKKLPPGKISFKASRNTDPDLLRFHHETEMKYLREMYSHLRSRGLKIPIAGDSMSWGFWDLAMLSSLREMDFTCSNTYWDLWGDEGHNIPLTTKRSDVFSIITVKFTSSHQPMFVSEWDMVWPHEWRSISPVMVASQGAFQGWAGCALHTYRYRNCPADCMGGTILGGVSYRRNFETFLDPAKFGLFYAAAILYRRGDVTPASETESIALTEHDIFESDYSKGGARIAAANDFERHRVEFKLPGKKANGRKIPYCDALKPVEDNGSALSDTGELYRNWRAGYGWVDTPRSKAFYGFSRLNGVPLTDLKLDGLAIELKTDFATICFTSLTDRSIPESAQILITAVGRADNTDACYNDAHTIRHSIGHGPVIYEVIEATFEMKTDQKKLKIWSVDQDGAYTGTIPCEIVDGLLKFEIGKSFPSIYYLITK